MPEDHASYFQDQRENSTPEFWARFGARPEVAGKRVLDLGCGHGALALDLASRGAQVLALDLDGARVDWAAENVHAEPPGKIEFRMADFTTLGLENEFDVIVSKDTFEHVEHLDRLLAAMRRALNETGRIWA
ncbi:MAG TPA: class I SAM-dependent methyltransferase, partial [Solirubrobacteraceae bacterium]|nr:class I SAM-dependent methyltransferase [Solirubrobacteraceae bacterium]